VKAQMAREMGGGETWQSTAPAEFGCKQRFCAGVWWGGGAERESKRGGGRCQAPRAREMGGGGGGGGDSWAAVGVTQAVCVRVEGVGWGLGGCV
jgi:hypothetical protein